jgi:hypothetical protein
VDNRLAGPEVGKLAPMEEAEWRLVLLIGHHECVYAISCAALEAWAEKLGKRIMHAQVQIYLRPE